MLLPFQKTMTPHLTGALLVLKANWKPVYKKRTFFKKEDGIFVYLYVKKKQIFIKMQLSKVIVETRSS